MRHDPDVAFRFRFRGLLPAGIALALGLIALQPSPGLRAGDLHTFTDTQGRTLSGEILSASAAAVRIRRDDGREFEIALATLCDADRRHVEAWKIRQAIENGALVVQSHRIRTESKLTHNKSTTTRDEVWHYVIQIENRSPVAIDGLSIEYRVFFTDDTAKADPDKLPLKRTAGQSALATIAAGAKTGIQTVPVALRITRRKDGREYSGTNKTRIEDELKGIWFRILREGDVVHEFASPDSLSRTESW